METLKQRLLEHIADLLDEPTFDISMRIQDCVDPLPNDQSELHLLMADAAFKVFCNYFGKQDTTKQCAINDVVFNEADLCDDVCKYYCTKGFTQERECLTDGYCKWCKQTPCERLNWSHPLEDDDE